MIKSSPSSYQDIQYDISFLVISTRTNLLELITSTTHVQFDLHIATTNDYTLVKLLEKQYKSSLIEFNKRTYIGKLFKQFITRKKHQETTQIIYQSKTSDEILTKNQTRFFFTDTTQVDQTIYFRINKKVNPNKD